MLLTMRRPRADERSSLLEQLNSSPLGAVAAIATAMIVVVLAPPLVFDTWTPRMAVLLFVGPVGLYLLTKLIVSKDAAAMALAAALVWAVFAGVLSAGPRAALTGTVGRDVSTLTVTLSAGLWAIGRALDRRDRDLVGAALVGATSFAAVIAVLQVVLRVESGPLALYGGRPTGTLTNPVYLGAVASVALVEAVRLALDSRWRRPALASAVLLGAAVTTSGSRVAAAATVLVLAGFVAVCRRRPAAVASLYGAFGLVVGVVLDRLVGTGANAVDRLGANGGTSGRTAVWRYGWSAWLERPLVGHGLGRFRPAVQGRFTPVFVRDFATDDLRQPWFDPHNIVVNLLVTVGAIGLLLFLCWIVLVVRRLSLGSAFVLLPLILHWLLQPVSLFTLPIAFLLLGAPSDQPPSRPALGRVAPVLYGVGSVMAISLVLSDVVLASAIAGDDGDRAAVIAELTLRDSVVSDVTAQIYAASGGSAGVRSAVQWQERAARSEPDRPYWWSRLAELELAVGDNAATHVAIERARELQPYNVRVWAVKAALARREADEPAFSEATALLCDLGISNACDVRMGD